MSSPQQKRVAAHQDSEHANGAKKSRVLDIPEVVVKQEQLGQGEEAGQGGQGEAALQVPVVQAMEMEGPYINNLRMAESLLHCHCCAQPFKPQTFQCEAGHIVCGACRGSHTQACAAAGAYVHCAVLDQILRGTQAPCAYEMYGCTSWVVYHKVANHHRSCRFAPCFCPVFGCGHANSPARLVEHFSSDHAWSVSKVDYAKPYKFAVPGPQDKLILVGAADGSVFLLSPCALGASTVVSPLVCIRACGDAAAGAQQYCCKLWTVGDDQLTLTSMVASSDMADGFPANDKGIMLPAGPAPPLPLMILIDKVGVSDARSRSQSSTPPPSLPRRMRSVSTN